MRLTHLLCLAFPIFIAQAAIAQQAPGGDPGASSAGGTEYYFGATTGSLAPYGIEGVRDLLPIWGLKFSHSFAESVMLEYDVVMANAKGVTYYLGYISFRYDFSVLDVLPLYAVIGGDFHYFKRKNTAVLNREFGFRTGTGWHAGAGVQWRLFARLYFRFDFRLGFGPGRQMVLTGGLVLRF